MKYIAVLLSVTLVVIVALSVRVEKHGRCTHLQGERDEDMVGPGGEAIFIGSGGGRYFLKEGQKIFVGYSGK